MEFDSNYKQLSSNYVLLLFVKLLILVIFIFMLADMLSSFWGLFLIFTGSSVPDSIKYIASASIALLAMISNACGKVIREILRQNFYIKVDKKSVEVCSKFVYYCTSFLPVFLAVWDWLTSFIGFVWLLSGQKIENMKGLGAIFSWYAKQFGNDILLAMLIFVCTICSSCAPYIFLRLCEVQNRISFIRQDGESIEMSEDFGSLEKKLRS